MTHRPPFQKRSGTGGSAVTGRKDDANKARASPETGCLKEAEAVYVANSEPVLWCVEGQVEPT
jgi:hypothetical protein